MILQRKRVEQKTRYVLLSFALLFSYISLTLVIILDTWRARCECTLYNRLFHLLIVITEEEDEDNMEEISTDNIINDGRRTRGKNIDFAKAAAEADDLDDDEDDDEDFEEKDEDAMEH